MTVPRGEIYKPKEVGIYHCVSRCVRRAFLCGFDTYSGVSYEHRRSWIRERLSFLVHVFTIELIAYAVMSNHLHTLIRNRPDLAAALGAEEVARRWLLLFPLRRERGGRPAEPNEAEIQAIAGNPTLVALYRFRLGDISWFNRCLCEQIARRANREDDCTGRFWEGRFKSQRVHDLAGVLACGVYVDLNPIRAGIAKTPEDSDYTSVQDRIRTLRKVAKPNSAPPLISIEEASAGQITTEQYLSLVDTTGRLLVDGKGSIPPDTSEILTRLKIRPENWLDTTSNYRHRFRRVVGPVTSVIAAAMGAGKKWLHGIASARAAFC